MIYIRWVRIGAYERGLVFRNGACERMLAPGRHLVIGPARSTRLERVSVREPWLAGGDLEVIARSGVLDGQAEVIRLADHERALVWIDGRLDRVLGPGLAVVWTVFSKVRVERIEAGSERFRHAELAVILAADGGQHLEPIEVAAGWSAVVYRGGKLSEVLAPGVHAYWRGEGDLRVFQLDRRERTLDVAGQEIMTADKVTLRLNAVVVFRITDPEKAVAQVEDATQALYRQAQLALREVVGGRELEKLLAEKEAVADELRAALRAPAREFGVEVAALGIRDVILPGEMKEILNRVTEARKAAEAALITRREETAAMRSQANTARIFESNPTLMRLRELEVLEKVAEKADLSVVLGESGLKERVMKLI